MSVVGVAALLRHSEPLPSSIVSLPRLYRIPTGLVVRAVVLADVDLALGAERPLDPQDRSRRTNIVDEIEHPVFLELDRMARAVVGYPQTDQCLAVFLRRRFVAGQQAAAHQRDQ